MNRWPRRAPLIANLGHLVLTTSTNLRASIRVFLCA